MNPRSLDHEPDVSCFLLPPHVWPVILQPSMWFIPSLWLGMLHLTDASPARARVSELPGEEAAALFPTASAGMGLLLPGGVSPLPGPRVGCLVTTGCPESSGGTRVPLPASCLQLLTSKQRLLATTFWVQQVGSCQLCMHSSGDILFWKGPLLPLAPACEM